jgi:hypothetical protein
MQKARKIAAQIERYAAFGYVTEIEAYQKDDAAILRAIDRLYDAQRSDGLQGDAELDKYREELRSLWKTARNTQAPASRASYYEGKAQNARARIGGDSGLQGYNAELKLARAKGKL